MTHHRRICLQGRDVSGFASILSRLLDEKGWSDTELARRSRVEAELLHEQYPEKGFHNVFEGSPDKIRNRLASIMLGRLGTKRRGSSEGINWERIAKQIFEDEIEVYAKALGVHLPWLRCAGNSEHPIVWNTDDEESHPEQIALLLKVYGKMVGEIHVFSKYVPHELMPEEFMHSFFEGLFQNAATFKSRSKIHKFTTIGNSMRAWAQRPYRIRAAAFSSIMLSSDLKSLANGSGVYAAVSKNLRYGALSNLKQLVLDSARNISIILDEGKPSSSVAPILKGRQALMVCGDVFSMEYDEDWNIRYWAGRSLQTIQNSHLVRSIHDEIKYNTPRQVEALLSKLLGTVK